MSKILIIGIGGAGANTVKHMKEVAENAKDSIGEIIEYHLKQK